MRSLRARLLAAASIVLVVFVAVTGAALTQANIERALVAQQDRMQGLVYSLLGATDVGSAGEFSLVTEELAEPRFHEPASGLDGAVFDADDRLVWLSPSSLEIPAAPAVQAVGTPSFAAPLNDAAPFRLDYSVRWHSEGDTAFHFTFVVREDTTAFFTADAGFRRRLWLWLLVPAGLLLLAQLGVLAWALRPLHRMEVDIEDLEAGRRDQVAADYPRELEPLSRALNALLAAEKTRRRRYSDALGDLSHSLKTPLAAARALLSSRSPAPDAIDEHLERMDRIIRFQLARAAAEAPGLLSAPVKVAPILERLQGTLAKVHAERKLKMSSDLDPDCTCRLGEDALFELLGNLFDNACKWARTEVILTLACSEGSALVTIDDDGAGFPDDDMARWLQRGARADQQHPGQGIGLAVSHDLLRAAGGELRLERSASGGARVVARLPQ